MTERLNPFGFNAFGHYSQGIKINLGSKTMVLTAGQIALNDDGTPVAPGDFTAQTRFIFKRIEQVLEVAGADMNDVVKAQFLLRMSANTMKFLLFGTNILRSLAQLPPWSRLAILLLKAAM